MKLKAIKMPVQHCSDCGHIVSIKNSMVRPFSVEETKKTTKVTCFDCEVKELVCHG